MVEEWHDRQLLHLGLEKMGWDMKQRFRFSPGVVQSTQKSLWSVPSVPGGQAAEPITGHQRQLDPLAGVPNGEHGHQ